MRRTVPRVIQYIIVTGFAILLAMPMLWALSASLHSNEDLFAIPFRWLPSPLQWENYLRAAKQGTFASSVLNSFLVAFVVATVGILLSQTAGYILAKFRFLGRDVIFWSIVATMMVPFPAIMVPVFAIAKAFGMIDTYAGLIVPGLIQASVVFFMRQYLLALPEEYLESARIDGASEWQTYARIVVPMTWPVLAAMAVLTFAASWNNLLWPLIVVHSERLYTLPLAMTNFQGLYLKDNVAIVALSVLSMIPTVVLFLLVRNRILESVMVSGGALK